jgi:hypothetical protein
MIKPLAIDLFCGLGGWTDGLLAEGFDVVGFDIEQHVYGDKRYPAQLVIQDVTTLHGSQFKGAALIVASPPCQGYSYRAMPWKRAKALPPPCNKLFDACFRIQREACEAAGHHIPLIVENVRGAQPWVGRARWSYGSFYLWGDVPALMPIVFKATKNTGGSWLNVAHNTTSGKGQNPDGRKIAGFRFDGSGASFQSAAVESVRSGGADPMWARGFQQTAADELEASGIKQRGSGREWFAGDGKISRMTSSKSPARKMASAMIAKIPLPLSRHIAATFHPKQIREAAE